MPPVSGRLRGNAPSHRWTQLGFGNVGCKGLVHCPLPLTLFRALGARSSHNARQALTPPLRAINIADLVGLDAPEIDGDISSYQRELGATFDASGVALTFGNRAAALTALREGVVVVDRSHWGRIRLAGSGTMAFLQNQSTNDFRALTPGMGCDTVFTTATGRCLDLVTVLVGDGSALLLVSPGLQASLCARFDKFIFPGDNVTVSDVTSRCSMITVAGPRAESVLREIGGDALTVLSGPVGSHMRVGVREDAGPVMVAVGSGLDVPGYTLIADEALAGDLYSTLVDKGCVPMGSQEWECARVLSGRPAAGAELTDAVTPLEASLYSCVSVQKGCYIGQETLSKVHTNNANRRQLWGLELGGAAAVGDVIADAVSGEEVGAVTSVVQTGDGAWAGLGYVRCRVGGLQVDVKGLEVRVNGKPARVRDIPFATRTFPGEAAAAAAAATAAAEAAAATASRTLQERVEDAKQQRSEAKSSAGAAKEEKLKELQDRLDAWKAQQAGKQ